MTTYRVLIADDHELARKGIASILRRDPAFQVVAEAATGSEAVQLALQLRPDLVLMDIRMPDGGLEATRRIKEQLPQVRVVMVTVSHDANDLFEAIRSGAQGYLLKDLAPDDWPAYLKGIMGEDVPVPRRYSEQVVQRLQMGAPEPTDRLRLLTDREREVLHYVGRGMTNREIAEALGISEYTVKNHVKSILQKLGCENRTQLVRFALERANRISREGPS